MIGGLVHHVHCCSGHFQCHCVPWPSGGEPSIMQKIHTAFTTVEFVFITGYSIPRAGEGLQFKEKFSVGGRGQET